MIYIRIRSFDARSGDGGRYEVIVSGGKLEFAQEALFTTCTDAERAVRLLTDVLEGLGQVVSR